MGKGWRRRAKSAHVKLQPPHREVSFVDQFDGVVAVRAATMHGQLHLNVAHDDSRRGEFVLVKCSRQIVVQKTKSMTEVNRGSRDATNICGAVADEAIESLAAWMEGFHNDSPKAFALGHEAREWLESATQEEIMACMKENGLK